MTKNLLFIAFIFTLTCQSQTSTDKIKWNYTDYTPKTFTFNKAIVNYFVEENKDSPRLSMDIVSDSTASTKVGSIKLSEILPTEVFDVSAYSYSDKLYLIKSNKDEKIYMLHEDVMYYQNWSKSNGTTLTKEYTKPQTLAKEKLILENYRLKLKNALSTVSKIEAINNKHLVNMVNSFGVIVEQKYDPAKFTKEEKVIYKQLVQKLKIQHEEIKTELEKKIDSKKTLTELISIPDINKQLQIEHAYNDYSYTASNW
ncbi:hypothetical protein K6T82_21235 [Flavobacterium sp. 17A]|uniref:Uncharacterized protein n=1 Tax=Flavobacterium potami TaxID=2872310 RepID=A0A9X1KRT8_9FLAO|nr:hypothetical protein [Flavobacterium potami]MBZ4037298.1 hypothetical protein [Flavobacterium potami]